MYHVELRQRPNVARAFNISEEKLQSEFLAPLFGGKPFEYAGHEWDGRQAHVTILEGPELAPNQLLLGRGWSNAEKLGADVTQRILAASRTDAARREVVQRASERILGRIAAGQLELDAVLALVDDLLAGRPASERYAAAAQAAWELLHRGQAVLLDATGMPVARDRWQELLLGWAGQTGDQATTSSISLARSASDANR
jgi:hypothetical protein